MWFMGQPTLCKHRNCFSNINILKIEVTLFLPQFLKSYNDE